MKRGTESQKSLIRKRQKNFFIFMLTFILVVGTQIMPVMAATQVELDTANPDSKNNTTLNPGDTVTWRFPDSTYMYNYTVTYVYPDGNSVSNGQEPSSGSGGTVSVTVPELSAIATSVSGTFDHWVLTSFIDGNGETGQLTLTAVMKTEAPSTPPTPPTPPASGGGKKIENKGPDLPPHEHHYIWKVTREATEDLEGEELYICEGCNAVMYRVPLSAAGVFIKNSINKILKADYGATVEISTRRWLTFNTAVCDALSSRPDVSVKLSYLEKGHMGDDLTTYIPAGTDLHPYLNDEGYVGFLCLKANFPTERKSQ
ncbi:MAG: hypothetical protein K6F54_09965 [Lachnospiraceae bacterium]|nr:hypothetical protein [Lachnospiraceae bacterium]